MLLTLRKKFICSTVLHTVFVLYASQLTAALLFPMRTSSITHMLCYITNDMFCYITYDKFSSITHDMLCYITHDILCYITHHMLRYITDDMFC